MVIDRQTRHPTSGLVGRVLLYSYSLSGQAGYLHYLLVRPMDMTVVMNGWIVLESLTALVLAGAVYWHQREIHARGE